MRLREREAEGDGEGEPVRERDTVLRDAVRQDGVDVRETVTVGGRVGGDGV